MLLFLFNLKMYFIILEHVVLYKVEAIFYLIDLYNMFYTTFTNFSMKYFVMCKVYTDVGGIR